MGYVACLGQIPEETAHVLQNLVSANGLTNILNIVDTCIIVVASILILKEQCVEQLFIINELQTIYVSKDGSKHIYEEFV